jgi:transposase InsO family protein
MREEKELSQRQDIPPPGGRRAAGRPGRPPKKSKRKVHPYELRRKVVQLYLEEKIPAEIVAQETGVSLSSIQKWTQYYQTHGEAGLRQPWTSEKQIRPKLSPVVGNKIREMKRAHPEYGVRRIAQLLKRLLFLPGSHETVRKTLHKAKLIPPVRKKAPKNPSKPRFFERSTPNQMWQSDIFPFKLGGEYAYLIGFIDDYSRYLVGLEVYRSQTTEMVLEVYRRAVGAYGAPKEMLTDNGRQYTNWRGKTHFEKALARDRVHHIKSRPHHPMTLGKIERFWKTIWEEFLVRAQFESFESARERIGWWVQYYNHKRPHQGLEGLCPADRFYEIQKEVREAQERGIAGNVQELALRGKPQKPFYMVGRMGEQSVVIRAERGQVRMTVDGEAGQENEMVYEMKGSYNEHEQDETGTENVQRIAEGGRDPVDLGGAPDGGADQSATGDQLDDDQQLGETGPGGYAKRVGYGAGEVPVAGGESGKTTGTVIGGGTGDGNRVEGSADSREIKGKNNENETDIQALRWAGKMSGGVAGMEREMDGGAGVQGDGHCAVDAAAVAGRGDGRDAVGPGTAGGEGTERARAGNGAETEATAGKEGGSAGREVAAPVPAVGGAGSTSERGGEIKDECERAGNAGPGTSDADRAGTERTADGGGSGAAAGGVPENVLQVGTACPGGDGGGVAGQGGRTACGGTGHGEGTPAGGSAEPAGGVDGTGPAGAGPDGAEKQ